MADTAPEVTLLKGLQPVGTLASEQRTTLATRGHVTQFEAGQRFTAAQEHHWLLYVLEGRVGLSTQGKPEGVDAGSARARQPIFAEGQLLDHAVALTSVRLLRLDRQLYERLKREHNRSVYEVGDVELTGTEEAVFTSLYQACMTGKLDLPALPETAVRIQAAMQDPDSDARQLARIVGMDLGITGGLVRAANSALYGASSPVVSVREAIVRLGMDATRRLVLTIAMQQVFRARSPELKRHMRELWDRSVHVSVLSFVIARHCKGFDPEHALLVGLLHRIGVVPILDYLGRHHVDVSAQELDAIVIKLHHLVGELVIGSWGMSSDLSQVVRESGNWYRDPGPTADYCDLILVAQLYQQNQSKPDLPMPRYDEIPAFAKLNRAAADSGLDLAQLELEHEGVQEMMAVLKGEA